MASLRSHKYNKGLKGFRYQISAAEVPFIGADTLYSITILGSGSHNEKNVKHLVNELFDKKGTWKPGKQPFTFSMITNSGYRAFIRQELPPGEEPEPEQIEEPVKEEIEEPEISPAPIDDNADPHEDEPGGLFDEPENYDHE